MPRRPLWVSLGALFIVILAASLGQAFLQFVGARIRDRIKWQPIRAVDAIGGAALSAVAVLLVAWALGVAISGSRIGGITPIVRDSTVLAEVDDVLPDQASEVLGAFNNVVGTHLLPALSRAVRARAHRQGRARPPAPAVRPRRARRRAERAQGARQQQLRRRHRGQRIPVRRRSADDQRPRRRRGGQPRGRARRVGRAGAGRRLQPRDRRRGARARRGRAAAPGLRPGRRGAGRGRGPRLSAGRSLRRADRPRSAPSSASARPTSTARAPCSATSSRCAR